MKKLIYTLAFVLILNLTFIIHNSAEAQWQADVRLTNDPALSMTGNNRSIASYGTVVHVVWQDSRVGNRFEIYYKRSTDAGLSWGTDKCLTNNNVESSYSPSIAVSGSVVHVVWYDDRNWNDEIYYKRSSDEGVTWGADTRLTNNDSTSMSPSVAVSGSAIHVVWWDQRDGNPEIYYKRSTDAGLSWGADTRLTNNTASSYLPSVAVSGSTVHVLWTDNRDGNYEIYYKRSTNEGLSWGADTRLTNNDSVSENPSVAVSSSDVHIVWDDNRDGNYKIYYKHSTNEGLSWGADTRLTNSDSASYIPSVAVSSSAVHVVWWDHRDGIFETYYKLSTNAGLSWGTDTRLSNSISGSFSPSVAIAGSVVNVVWSDIRDGNDNEEIYYKRNPTGNPTGIIYVNSEIPSSYSLSQNYPNPFNPTTNVQFSMCNVQYVILQVYDILGKEVATLVNEQLQPGSYEVNWNASQYSSGVYFYRLQTDGYTETKRMTLIK